MFVDAPNGDLHLVSTAAAIGAVDTLTDVPQDIDAQDRPAGGTTDAGADQYAADTTPSNPPGSGSGSSGNPATG